MISFCIRIIYFELEYNYLNCLENIIVYITVKENLIDLPTLPKLANFSKSI